MPLPILTFDDLQTRLVLDLELAHKFVHGTDTETIVVDSGTIPTLANMAKALPFSDRIQAATDQAIAASLSATHANTAEQAALGHKNAAAESLAAAVLKAASANLSSQTAATRAGEVVIMAATVTQLSGQTATNAAIAANHAAALTASSSSSNVVESGVKVFEITSGKQFQPMQWVIAAASGGAMSGQVVSYVGTTLTLNVVQVSGTGTHTEWTLGLSGAPGSQGVAGSAGANGSQGVKGDTGAQGIQGLTGSAGVAGSAGANGSQGVKGDTGAQGIQGLTGSAGVAGSAGANGSQGVKGDTGAQGIQGTAGVASTTRVYLDKGTVSTGVVTFDMAAAQNQRLQVGGALTLAMSNWPLATAGLYIAMLELVNGAAAVVTWPTIRWVLADGTYTTTFSANTVTLQTTGTDFVMLWSRDGGATIYGRVVR
jgi:hypothetical protein